MTDRPPALTARTFALLALGSAAFTIYGSLIPFEFRPKTWAAAAADFRTHALDRLHVDSKSDFVANVLLGGPIGFCLLAALRVDRPANPTRAAASAGAVWPVCVLFAAAVEFSQLFTPGRMCTGSDIVAQSMGSALGIAAWLAAGPKLTRWARGVWTSRRVGGTAGRMLIVYLGLLALAQLLPLDLTLSPAIMYQKWKAGQVTLVPFAEPAAWAKVQGWLELAGLYLPAGMLAAGVPAVTRGRAAGLRVFGLGLLLAAALESLQMLVRSRWSSATDVLIGGAAVAGGWAVARVFAARGRGISTEAGLVLAQAWLLVLVVVNWQPFDFTAGAGARLAGVNWIPFAAAGEKNYLSSLEEAVSKTLLYTPLGAVVAAVGPFVYRTRRPLTGALIGAAVAALLEAGQLFLPHRYPGPTDLVFGAVGGWLGAAAVFRLRCASPEARALAAAESIFAPPDDRPVPLPGLAHESAIRVHLAGEKHR